MKKWLFLMVVLVSIVVLGGRQTPGTDIAKLQPVHTLRISKFNGYITVETDTGTWGMGGDLQDALKRMEQSSVAVVFLDTAEYLLIDPELIDLLPELENHLRPSCCICLEDGQPDMTAVGQYLQTHEPGVSLKDYLAGETDLPTLLTTEEGMSLVH